MARIKNSTGVRTPIFSLFFSIICRERKIVQERAALVSRNLQAQRKNTCLFTKGRGLYQVIWTIKLFAWCRSQARMGCQVIWTIKLFAWCRSQACIVTSMGLDAPKQFFFFYFLLFPCTSFC
ncbi:hypothetical protein AMTRI_Chr11g154790 [Amborella trichopoda]